MGDVTKSELLRGLNKEMPIIDSSGIEFHLVASMFTDFSLAARYCNWTETETNMLSRQIFEYGYHETCLSAIN